MKKLTWLVMGLILLLGVALRLGELGAVSLWGDEINVAVAARGSIGEVLEGARSHISAPPLDYLVVHLLETYVGDSEFILRLGAVAWSILSIPLMYQLGKRVAGPWAGAAGALLLATSPFHVMYSREVKFYAALLFFALLSNIAFLQTQKRPGWRAWLVYSLVNTVGIYFHPFVALVIACQGLYLLVGWILDTVRRPGKRITFPREILPYAISVAATAACFAPWYFWDFAKQTPIGQYYLVPDLSLVSKLLKAFGIGSAWSGVPMALLAVIGAAAGLSTRARRFTLLLVLDLLAIGLVVVLDNLKSYWFDRQQTLFALPAYLALVSGGLLFLYDRAKHLRWNCLPLRATSLLSAIAIVAGAGLFGSVSSVEAWTRQTQDWRGVGDYLTQNVHPGDLVIQTWVLQPNSLAWYYHPAGSSVAVLRANMLRTTPLKLQPGGNVWWVLLHNGGTKQLNKEAGEAFDVVSFASLAVLHKKGGVASSEDALDATVTLLELQGALSPPDTTAYENLADDLLRGGQADLARFYVARGNEQAGLGQWEASALSFERAAVCQPNWGMIQTKLGNAYRALGRWSDAEASYERSIQIDPAYVGAYLNLGGIRQTEGREDEALSLYQKAVAVAPDSAWAHSALGGAYLRTGDSNEALVHLRRSVELEPENPAWLLALADGYRSLGMRAEAVDAYRQALVLDPGNNRATKALKALEP